MSDEPEYYTLSSLAKAAGVSLRTLHSHQVNNVGQINDAREWHKGLGLRYVGRKCRKYLALVRAGKESG